MLPSHSLSNCVHDPITRLISFPDVLQKYLSDTTLYILQQHTYGKLPGGNTGLIGVLFQTRTRASMTDWC